MDDHNANAFCLRMAGEDRRDRSAYQHGERGGVERDGADGRVNPILDFTEPVESEREKPLVTGGNQATFWAALRAAGVDDRLGGFGKLLKEH